MQNSGNSSSNLQDVVTSTIRNLATNSLSAYKPLMDGMINTLSTVNKAVTSGDYSGLKLPTLYNNTSNCCAPTCECPPHCIAAISRCAMPGERIIVPFMVKNNCSQAKTYRVGVRELKDEDGNEAPSQPKLNKPSVTVEPGRSERVLMLLDLEKFTNNGATYTTEIVLREKNVNQNICFTLKLDNDCNVVTAEPQDEQKMQMHWQSWQSHFYCEPKKVILQRIPGVEG